ncbi:hypothetical protein [Curtobacterium sp. MCBD17_023]|uniref:hypothetical protein n=1 Tax=Curtobacterium sp. MCBD17_023 TaxID=2175657 RepID=UPI0015E8A57C|nr:hypothetical protein [Curtobacterium sp. MCBD17_023]
MSMSAPFNPVGQPDPEGAPVDSESLSEIDRERGQAEQVEAGIDNQEPATDGADRREALQPDGDPVFRTPHPGDRLHPDDLT